MGGEGRGRGELSGGETEGELLLDLVTAWIDSRSS